MKTFDVVKQVPASDGARCDESTKAGPRCVRTVARLVYKFDGSTRRLCTQHFRVFKQRGLVEWNTETKHWEMQ
jgi:hypothetical protein